MFLLETIIKKRSNNSQEAYSSTKPRHAVQRERVLATIYKLEPCHYRQISQALNVIEGCVTPRINELRKLQLVKVAYVKKGPSGSLVNYYQLSRKGIHHLVTTMGEYV